MQPVDAAAVSQQQVSCERVDQCTGARLDLQTNHACSSTCYLGHSSNSLSRSIGAPKNPFANKGGLGLVDALETETLNQKQKNDRKAMEKKSKYSPGRTSRAVSVYWVCKCDAPPTFPC